MTPNTRTLKGQSYCSQRWANPAWPKGSKSRGFSSIHANILEVLERDGKRRCPACGRTVKGKQRYCGAGCRDFMTPGPTVEQVAEKANRNIRKLASLAAGKDKAYRKRLIEKYTVGPS